MNSEREEALVRAVRYVLEAQQNDGSWKDFDLTVGSSDAWTTAYIGLCLSEALDVLPIAARRRAEHALEAAAKRASANQRANGWGFNSSITADCDSTAWNILFLHARGRNVPESAYQAVLAFHRSDGGFATYGADGSMAQFQSWTISHPDVTPVALRALSTDRGRVDSVRETQILRYIDGQRRLDGLWNSFWYASPLYSTLQNLRAIGDVAGISAATMSRAARDVRAQGDPFELALLLQIAFRSMNDVAGFSQAGVGTLLERQFPDGRWMAAPMLRVAEPTIEQPWQCAGDAGGKLFADDRCLFTTATVIGALSASQRVAALADGSRAASGAS